MSGAARFLVLVAAVAALFNAAIVAVYVYASLAVSADIDGASRVQELLREGVFNFDTLNARLTRDGRSYQVDTNGAGGVGLNRDYFMPRKLDQALGFAGISAIMSLFQCATVTIGLVISRRQRQPRQGA